MYGTGNMSYLWRKLLDVSRMSSVKKLMDMVREKLVQGQRDHEQSIIDASLAYEQVRNEAQVLRDAAQKICSHEYVTTVNWTEDGAFPNEPHSRIDCTLCGKEGVM